MSSKRLVLILATLVLALLGVQGLAYLSTVSAEDIEPIPSQETKQCVDGDQTEDPNSPPCQAFFEEDNGGATWQGVTADEIKVVIYQNTAITFDHRRLEPSPPGGTLCDVDLLDCDGDGEPDDDPHVWLRIANAYSRYFNARFQTYDRHVHTYVYWTHATTAAARRADAADIHDLVAPFAVSDQAWRDLGLQEFSSESAQRNTMVFGSHQGWGRSFYQARAPYLWSWWPDGEDWADQYSDYVCRKVVPTKVATGEFKGQDRKYAAYYTTDPSYPQLAEFAGLVRERLTACGITIADQDVYTFPNSGYAVDTSGDRLHTLQNATRMKLSGANTILWIGGSETDTSKAADLLGYRPEWIVAGDGLIDSNSHGQLQGQVSWSSAWAHTIRPRPRPLQDDYGYQAYKEAEPDGEDGAWAVLFYKDWFMLFYAIQAAGSELTPDNVDAGLHAIQPSDSASPYDPALYFHPGNYTFVKDGAELWWDLSGLVETRPGCWRLVAGGFRKSAGDWAEATNAGLGKRTEDGSPDGAERDATRDPCTSYRGTISGRA